LVKKPSFIAPWLTEATDICRSVKGQNKQKVTFDMARSTAATKQFLVVSDADQMARAR
jgi:hypothetical protein